MGLVDLWKALVARLVFWLSPKPPAPPAPVIVAAPELPMKPGVCECSHLRCAHVGGKGRCVMEWPPSEKWPNGSHCCCQTFILDDDDDAVEMYEKDGETYVRIVGDGAAVQHQEHKPSTVPAGTEWGIRIATEVNDWGRVPVRD